MPSVTASVPPSSPLFPSYLRYFRAGDNMEFNDFRKLRWIWRIYGGNTSKSFSGIMIRVYYYYFPVLVKVYLRHLVFRRI